MIHALRWTIYATDDLYSCTAAEVTVGIGEDESQALQHSLPKANLLVVKPFLLLHGFMFTEQVLCFLHSRTRKGRQMGNFSCNKKFEEHLCSRTAFQSIVLSIQFQSFWDSNHKYQTFIQALCKYLAVYVQRNTSILTWAILLTI